MLAIGKFQSSAHRRYVIRTMAFMAPYVLVNLGAIFGAWQQPLLMVLFAFIFFVGEMEYRAAVRREIEDAHWRAVLARFNGVASPSDLEPKPG